MEKLRIISLRWPLKPSSAPTGRRTAIGLIALSLFTGAAGRYVLTPMQELVKADMGLGDNQVALLMGMAIALPTALVSIPIGRLVDRTSRTRLLIVLALICAGGSVLTAMAHNFTTVFVARMLVGASVVAAQTAALSLIADLSPPSQRGRMITIVSLGQAFGGAAAFALTGTLLGWLNVGQATMLSSVLPLPTGAPWRIVQLAFAAALVLGVLPLLWIREPVRQETSPLHIVGFGNALRALWEYRRFLLPLIGGLATVGMADAAAMIWAVPVLTRKFHLVPADFATWMGVLNLASGTIGAILGGLSADIGERRGGQAGVILGAVLGAALSVPASLFPLAPSVGAFAILLALMLTSGACANIAATSAIMIILPNQLRGLCISLVIAVIAVVAFGIAPLLVSLAAQEFTLDGEIVVPLTCIGVVTSILATAGFLRAMRFATSKPQGTER